MIELESLIIYAPLLIPALVAVIFVILYVLKSFPFLGPEYTQLIDSSFDLIVYSAPVFIPLLLIYIFWETWIQYVRAKYNLSLEWLLLEIRLPQDIFKSPLAMETFLMSLWQVGSEVTFIDRSIKGQTRAEFSLEIVSVEGVVKFYIRAQKKFRNMIENGLFAQYPNIEIHESTDYTKSVHFDRKEMDLFITDYELLAPDPFPIKTYVDYGLERESVDEEYKVDPINSILEFMGSIGANQQCWLQIIIRAHRKEQKKHGTFFSLTDRWIDEAKEEIQKIKKAALPEGDTTTTKFPNPTKGEQERIVALERSVSKFPFDAGVRCIYFGKNDFYDKSAVGQVRGLLRAYSAQNLNGFKPAHWLAKFDYPWQDFRDIRQNAVKKEGLEAYKRRCFFFPPFNEGKILVLNVEELASIFHLPGKVATTPNLTRIPSKKAQAPANLPI